MGIFLGEQGTSRRRAKRRSRKESIANREAEGGRNDSGLRGKGEKKRRGGNCRKRGGTKSPHLLEEEQTKDAGKSSTKLTIRTRMAGGAFLQRAQMKKKKKKEKKNSWGNTWDTQGKEDRSPPIEGRQTKDATGRYHCRVATGIKGGELSVCRLISRGEGPAKQKESQRTWQRWGNVSVTGRCGG